MLHLAFLLLIPAVVAIALLDVVLRTVLGSSVWWSTEDNMPVRLMLSTLYLSEAPLSTQSPIPLHGTPDQVFLSRRGQLLLVDTKVRGRHRVDQADIIQLSVYRVILAHTQGSRPVARFGYIRTVTPNAPSRHRVRYHKVRLLPERTVVSLHQAQVGVR